MNSLVKNSSLYLIATITIKACTFLLLPFYSHLISPAEYGYVFVVVALVNFMSFFFNFSLGGALQRFYFDCQGEDEVKKLYTTIVLFVFILTVVCGLFFYLFRIPFSNVIKLPLPYYDFAVLISSISAFYPLILSLLYVMQSAKKISVTTIVLGCVGICVQLSMVVLLENKAMAMIEAMLLNAMLTFVIFLVYSKPFFSKPSISFDKLYLYLKYSLSQLPSDISVWLIQCSDRIILNSMKGSAFAGLYGMGANLGNIPQILFHSINKAYVPYVFGKYKDMDIGKIESEKDVTNATFMVFTVMTVFISIVAVFSNNVVSLLAPQYARSSFVMLLVLFAVWVDCCRIIFMNPIAYKIQYIKIKSVIWVTCSILAIFLNFHLIPIYGMYGACVSLILSYSLSCVFIIYFSHKAIPLQYNKMKILKIVLYSGVFSLSYLLGTGFGGFVLKLVSIFLFVTVVIHETISLKKGVGYVKVLLNKFKKNI